MEQLVRSELSFYDKMESVCSTKWFIWWYAFVLGIIVFLVSGPNPISVSNFQELWDAVLLQAKSPLTPQPYDAYAHEGKLTFRLTTAYIIKFLGLNEVGSIMMHAICGLGIFVLFHRILLRILKDKVSAILLVTALAFTYMGKVSFVELRAIFDGVALFFLSVSMVSSAPALIFVGVFFAAWTDERALIASSFVFLFWHLFKKSDQAMRYRLSIQQHAVVLAWMFYFGLRYFLTVRFQLPTNTGGIALQTVIHNVNNFPIALCLSLEGFWVMLSLALLIMLKFDNKMFGLQTVGCVLIVIMVASLVDDTLRSLVYLFPVIFIAAKIISEKTTTLFFRRLSLIVLFICLLMPAYYVDRFGAWLILPGPLQLIKYFELY